jgi:hypothetical protein
VIPRDGRSTDRHTDVVFRVVPKAPPSPVFESLQTRLADVDDLMNAHVSIGGKAGRPRGVEGLNRAAIVMLCAHLEGYVEDLFREALKAVHPKLDAAPLLNRFNTPKPANIDALFGAIGLPKASGGISWRGVDEEAVTKSLNKLVETRGRIAHGRGVAVHVPKETVVRFRRYVEGFTREFDQRVWLHVLVTMKGKPSWVPDKLAQEFRTR